MFGSVPLRTFLPDGDIDLSVFCSVDAAAGLRDTWAARLQVALERAGAAPSAPFVVGDVTVINAEVKLLKCIVDDIVVDVSLAQMGGLVTLNFLEEVNSLIGRSNLFKRSIILVRMHYQVHTRAAYVRQLHDCQRMPTCCARYSLHVVP